ncbi:MAG: mycothiol system anti-sigma-R factor [candidate division Zixibacteria bacterium]
MMTCQEAVDRLNEYLDRELDNLTSDQIDKHLDLCRLCCDHFEFEKKMKSLVQKSCIKEKAPAFLRDRILGIFKK